MPKVAIRHGHLLMHVSPGDVPTVLAALPQYHAAQRLTSDSFNIADSILCTSQVDSAFGVSKDGEAHIVDEGCHFPTYPSEAY